ncbi:hypothetical protein [Cerasicoccus maritimus]|uniref:hypothetical protein n=1 Tax=Cerasicoccus maritimus TaxID=490089 RepID=UPI002852A4E9|nr:hypothetical protein [Cerasicoccus maritimus]
MKRGKKWSRIHCARGGAKTASIQFIKEQESRPLAENTAQVGRLGLGAKTGTSTRRWADWHRASGVEFIYDNIGRRKPGTLHLPGGEWAH